MALVTLAVAPGACTSDAGDDEEAYGTDTAGLTLSATVDDGAIGNGTNQFSYSGGSWTNCGGCAPGGAYKGAFRYAYAAGDKLTFKFSGTSAKLHAVKEKVGGIASVTLDGAAQPDLDLYAATQSLGAVYTTKTVAAGTHTLVVTVSGRKNGASGGTSLTIDKAEVFSGGSTPPTPTGTGTGTPPPPSSGTWLSGASGIGVANGDFGNWRGRPVDIASTWVNSNDGMVNLYTIKPGAEYGSWQKSIDIAIGGIDDQAGESWQAAASGAYDGRWRQSLTNLKSTWGSRAGTCYIRLAHEMNGFWFPWKVTSSNYTSFIAAWKRFRGFQKELFPAGKLVFSVNRESNGNGMDWRKTFPGSSYVDVMSVDYYNQYPWVGDSAKWDSSIQEADGYGAPKGLAKHLEFAKSVGLPLAISEWSGNADMGDSPVFIQKMHDFFAAHAGTGAGQLIYEVQFNVDIDGKRWLLFPSTRMPNSAAKYKDVF